MHHPISILRKVDKDMDTNTIVAFCNNTKCDFNNKEGNCKMLILYLDSDGECVFNNVNKNKEKRESEK